ncbi:ferritin-like domain-containing protein [Actinokineospora diospyrosa]|uniref:Ferritin-like domain-containing protein n=1 Tax=Actinokineospora diospyrosa TaxID=103728 RepID=A0ABT1IEU3_9PSEU|nr:ferritin-like domain-containing protein [Actinokineospora diospyrosa]MCP2271071.1 Ferritin-like domain-containing protein [Actinokineospora diospyrosa]
MDPIDERGLRELLVESDDLQSDAMRTATRGLDDYVEAVLDTRERSGSRDPGGQWPGWSRVAAVTGLAGAGAVLAAWPAAADPARDVQALQTAASLENLAVATYKTALTLPFIGGADANAVVKAFAEKTMAQHIEHGQAFNGAVAKLGGKAQNDPNAKYAAVVKQTVPTIKGAGDVVALAIALEDVAAQTYTKNVSQVSTPELRQLFASVAGVESQHKAILLAVKALIDGGAPQLIALPPDAAKLPDAAGGVGFPDAFFPTEKASPVEEGAVK